MTSQTFAIEIYRFRFEVMMRIVARQTTDARILGVLTFAARQPVRLETNIGNARVRLGSNFRPGAMALPTKF